MTQEFNQKDFIQIYNLSFIGKQHTNVYSWKREPV